MVKTNKLVAQAEQGSIAAIIQVLNQNLAASGVRVRAVLVRGVLQLLCEAADTDRLERHQLVQRIRQILEALHPKHIRRVCINSRIVNEQQLLWLDEINRDPTGQLLWSEEILLSRPNPLFRWVKAVRATPEEPEILPASTERQRYAQRQYWRGLWGGAALGAGLLLVGGLLYSWLQADTQGRVTMGMLLDTISEPERTAPQADAASRVLETNPSAANPTPAIAPNGGEAQDEDGSSPEASAIAAAEGRSNLVADDPFTAAVRLAEQSASQGQTANTSDEWLTIASSWQLAAKLMGQVAADDSRYPTAQDRYLLYQTYEAQARTQAQQAQTP